MFIFFKPESAESEKLFVFSAVFFFFSLRASRGKPFFSSEALAKDSRTSSPSSTKPGSRAKKKKEREMKKKSEHKWWASWPETSGPYTKNHYGDSNQGAPEGGAAGSIREGGS